MIIVVYHSHIFNIQQSCIAWAATVINIYHFRTSGLQLICSIFHYMEGREWCNELAYRCNAIMTVRGSSLTSIIVLAIVIWIYVLWLLSVYWRNMQNNFPSHRQEASWMSFSQRTSEWHVDWICYSLSDSLQIMQLCCHCGVTLPSAVHIVINDIHYSWYQRTLSSKTQQSIVNMRSGGISASLPQVPWVSKSHPSQREWSQPKNDMTEGIIMFTDYMMAESILLTGVS